MGLVAGAARLVGLDSAPLHMASGFAVEALGLFGPTDPALTGPWRGAGASIRPTGAPPHVRYRHTDERWMRQLSVGMVLDRLAEHQGVAQPQLPGVDAGADRLERRRSNSGT